MTHQPATIRKSPKPDVLKSAFAIGVLILLTALVYLPGLSGSFHFDDFPNLEILHNYGRISSFDTFLLYLDERVASTIGRPLSVLTFLLQQDAWPNDPQRFLIVNIILHCINAALVFALVLVACGNAVRGHLRGWKHRIAFLASALWACNPFLVSTTLYVVQRMTLLSTTFVLLGLLLFLLARAPSSSLSKGWKSEVAYGSGVMICGVLAVLAKENGSLIFPLIVVTEYLLVRRFWEQPDPSSSSSKLVLAVGSLPTILLSATFFFIYFLPPLVSDYENGSLESIGKLITQPLAFLYYLGNLLAPRTSYGGLYYDGHFLTTWWKVWPYSLAALFAAVIVAWVLWKWRHRVDLVCFAATFFFVALSIELLHPRLEPVFEHRAYLPSVVLFMPIAAWVVNVECKYFSIALVCLLLGWFSVATAFRSDLWGRPSELKREWSESNEYSNRAALAWFYDSLHSADYYSASTAMEKRRDIDPTNPHVLLMEYELARVVPFLVESMDSLSERFASARLTKRLYEVAEKLVVLTSKEARFSLDDQEVLQILEQWLMKFDYSTGRQEYLIRSHRLSLALNSRDFSIACDDARYFIVNSGDVNNLVGVAVLFARANAHVDALNILGVAKEILASSDVGLKALLRDHYIDEIEILERAFLVDGGMRDGSARCDYWNSYSVRTGISQ